MARRIRRFWSEEEKRRIVAQDCAPGVSVSQVGRRYDVNANLIFKWRRDPRYKPAAGADDAPSFLPVEVVPEPASPPAQSAVSDGRIEIALPSGHRVRCSADRAGAVWRRTLMRPAWSDHRGAPGIPGGA